MTSIVKISAVIHTYNDDTHLEECLSSIRWCDELLVIDLGSMDRSVAIAEKFADRVLHHEWVPIVEQVRPWSYAQAAHDWLLCVDPDEIYNPELSQKLRCKLDQYAETAAFIRAPFHFYFRRKPLNGCMWYPNFRLSLQNRSRVVESRLVHTSAVYDGEIIDIEWGEVPPIIHYWNDSWRSFIISHWRYIKLEGVARYERGKRFCIISMLLSINKMYLMNLIIKRGYRAGLDGILLSFAMAIYEGLSHLSLLKYQFYLKFNRIQ